MSRLFPKTLTPDGKYPLLDTEFLTQRIQMQLSQKRKTLPEFFSSFLKSSSNLENFQKKDDTYSSCISEITDSEKHG